MIQEGKKNIANDPSRLRWACRRGMLELDLLLGAFLDNQYPLLNDFLKYQFVDLLAAPDPQLFDWLFGQAESEETNDLIDIIRAIRTYAVSRFQVKAL